MKNTELPEIFMSVTMKTDSFSDMKRGGLK